MVGRCTVSEAIREPVGHGRQVELDRGQRVAHLMHETGAQRAHRGQRPGVGEPARVVGKLVQHGVERFGHGIGFSRFYFYVFVCICMMFPKLYF